jgi:sulfate adenylyltransferase subunit 1
VIPAANDASSGNRDPLHRRNQPADLLRFTTAGSVDDGKSTLIGRLLHDSRSVYEDQLAAVRASRINRSGGPIDFALLTDGLRAEREQGITIDVAYRYFQTRRRKFIIADTPGHEQYTRNMVTGASTAHLALILIDASKGLLRQTRRHAYIASLLGIPTVLAVVNKMDLVGYDQDAFRKLEQEFSALAAELRLANVRVIPLSALEGENVVGGSGRMPWYQGPPLLEHLETVPLPADGTLEALRFPVQYVIRPDASFRGFAGQVAGGTIRPGDSVVALPSGRSTAVRSIVTFDGDRAEAFPPMSVTLTLEDEIDLSRGEMLVSPSRPPHVSRRFAASVVWFDSHPLVPGQNYLIKHTARSVRGRATRIRYRVNMDTLAREAADRLQMNDVAEVEFEAASPLFFDSYRHNRATGSFILIDPLSNATIGAAMFAEDLSSASPLLSRQRPASAVLAEHPVTPGERYRRHGHYPAVIWVEDRAALAVRLERALFARGFEALLLTDDSLPQRDWEGVLRVAQSLGLILVCASGAVDTAVKRRTAEMVAGRLIDLSAIALPADDEQAVEQILPRVESLRMDDPGLPEGGKANG